MLEILVIVLLGIIVKDHSARMKELGQQARNYGKQEA